ncbi:VOC family protein [Acidobacteria bacterium AB60]|nr:VOC family protein [Acidobacteria bacterium AB60]
MPNPIVYFEIVGKDKAVLEDFYRTLFDWQLTPANDRYTHVAPGAGVNGGIGKSMDGGPGHVTFYVEVESIADALTRVEGRGGRRLMEPEQMPNGPLIALFADPEGRVVGLIEAGTMRNG